MAYSVTSAILCTNSAAAIKINSLLRWVLLLWVVQSASCVYASPEYDALMAKAISAYADEKLVKSEMYLKQALKLQPNDISAKSILKDLHKEIFSNLLDKAQMAFNQEHWQDALDSYQKAKSLGIPRKNLSKQISTVLLYIEAERRLNKYVADIEALIDAGMRENANNTLRQIQKFKLSGKVINKNVKKLKEMLERLEKIYTVNIKSDSKSEIIIYKVGSLGRFRKQSIELMPGKYIAIARCLGYKEFRYQFKVLPDSDNSFYVRCEEVM